MVCCANTSRRGRTSLGGALTSRIRCSCADYASLENDWLEDTRRSPERVSNALLHRDDVDNLKTRVVAKWLEDRSFSTKLLERRVDAAFRRTEAEPVIALSGFDDNRPRHWLAAAGFERVFDSGLGGEAHNFDTIAFRMWPNPRSIDSLWPLETSEERGARDARKRRLIEINEGYRDLAEDECGRLNHAGNAIAVPFVGALAASIVVGELLKSANGCATHSELKARACLLGSVAPAGRVEGSAAAIRGLPMQSVRA